MFRLKATIISIGNELIQGRVVNTNASYLSRRLTLLGIDVVAHIVIGDNFDDVSKALDTALRIFGSNIIITTGGLGPTYDDITSEAIARYLGEEYVINEEALREVKEKYESRNMPLTPERIKMAYMPKSAKSLRNPVGIAPGFMISKDNFIIIALPGVPAEMEGIWESSVEPYLKRFSDRRIAETYIRLVGAPESTLAAYINRFVRGKNNVYVKTHPKGHETRGPINDLYIMVSTSRETDPSEECFKICNELIDILKKNINDLIIEGECKCNRSL
ncbi:MAG: nicotinamide mononucleotide deamidase-related protein [Sulfolobales archaeon]